MGEKWEKWDTLISMHERMPRSKSWASQGGTSPTKVCNETKINTFIFKRMTQPTLRLPREDQGEMERKEERKTELHSEQGELVVGCTEEDDVRYRTFLKYCEERRLA